MEPVAGPVFPRRWGIVALDINLLFGHVISEIVHVNEQKMDYNSSLSILKSANGFRSLMFEMKTSLYRFNKTHIW